MNIEFGDIHRFSSDKDAPFRPITEESSMVEITIQNYMYISENIFSIIDEIYGINFIVYPVHTKDYVVELLYTISFCYDRLKIQIEKLKNANMSNLLIFRTIMNDDERQYFIKARYDGEHMIEYVIKLFRYLKTILQETFNASINWDLESDDEIDGWHYDSE